MAELKQQVFWSWETCSLKCWPPKVPCIWKCDNHKALLSQISVWKQHFDLCGFHSKHDSHTLRGFLMGLLSRYLEDKRMPKFLKYPMRQSIRMYIKERSEGGRELEIARSIHAKRPISGRVNAMNKVTEQQPPVQPITGPSN